LMDQYASYLRSVDPYDHPVTVHHTHSPMQGWYPFLGDKNFDLTSFQYYAYSGSPGTANWGADVEMWRTMTENAGHSIPISLDEPRMTTTTNMSMQRKELLWPTYFSGGGGIEWSIDGWNWNEDFRKYNSIYKWTGYATKFMQQNLPFWQMTPSDSKVTGEVNVCGGAQVFAKSGEIYAVYLPDASSSTDAIDLTGVSGTFSKQWYNPRTGSFEGGTATVSAGGKLSLGTPPSTATDDWVVLYKHIATPAVAARAATSTFPPPPTAPTSQDWSDVLASSGEPALY